MLYLDTSAAVKLVNREIETDALLDHLCQRPAERLVSVALIRTELRRAVGRPSKSVETLLRSLAMVELTGSLLDEAGIVGLGSALRSFDAIHLVAARRLGAELSAVVTYDRRMAHAATSLGLQTVSPGEHQ